MVLRVAHEREFLRLCMTWQPPFVAVEETEDGYIFTAAVVLPGYPVFLVLFSATRGLVQELKRHGVEVVEGRVIGDAEVLSIEQLARTATCPGTIPPPLEDAIKELEKESERLRR